MSQHGYRVTLHLPRTTLVNRTRKSLSGVLMYTLSCVGVPVSSVCLVLLCRSVCLYVLVAVPSVVYYLVWHCWTCSDVVVA